MQDVSLLNTEMSILKKTVEALVEKKLDEKSLRKDINDLQKEIETLRYLNQETHQRNRLKEEEFEERIFQKRNNFKIHIF